MILGFPVWVAYIALVISFAVLTLTALYLAWLDVVATSRQST